MRNPIVIVLTLLWVVRCSSVSAQSSQYVSATTGVSCEQLAQMALTRNPELQAASESLHQADARLRQVRLLPNPSLDVSKKTDAIFANEGDRGYSITVSEPVDLGGRRGNRVKVAETSVEVAKADIAEAERQLLGRLRLLCTEAMGAAARSDLFERLDRAGDQMSGVMSIRVRAGDASQLDARLLQAQTSQLRAQRLVAENQLAGFLIQIRGVAGLSPDEPLLLKRTTQPVDSRETEDASIARALEARPDLKAARLRETLAEAGIDLAKSQMVPQVTAFARYGQESVLSQLATGAQKRTFQRENVVEFGVSIPLPVFNREQGNIAETASRRAQARREREGLEASVRRDVVLAFRRYETARKSLDILQSGVLEQNQASTRIVQLAYDLGELRFLDIVNQQRVLIDAETSVVNAEQELSAARADLDNAIGEAIVR
jgi:cobalt-zinc-cadmium efflux system outer membrane protein